MKKRRCTVPEFKNVELETQRSQTPVQNHPGSVAESEIKSRSSPFRSRNM